MASINLQGDTSGSISISAPSVAGSNTLTLPATTQTLATQNSLGVRNLIINGDMRIAQRGTSAVTTNLSFPVDRWTMYNSGGTFTAQQQTFTLGDAPDSRLQNYVRLTRSSPSGILYFTQKIEDVINSNNVTVTVSFYAKANTDITVPVRLVQVFGSGGSTAVTVDSINNSVTSSWQRFTATFTCPSLSGKTIGTSSYLELTFDTPDTYSTLDITGVQLEVGTEATPFEHRPYDMELARCQRYYEKSYSVTAAPGSSDAIVTNVNPLNRGGGTGAVGYPIYYRVSKRANPTVTPYTYDGTSGQWHNGVIGSSEAKGNATIEDAGTNYFKVVVLYSVTPNAIYGHWVSSAEL